MYTSNNTSCTAVFIFLAIIVGIVIIGSGSTINLSVYFLIFLAIFSIGLLIIGIYAFRRGSTNISYSCDIELENSHVVSFATSTGWFRDRLDVLIDRNVVTSVFASSWNSMFHRESLHKFYIDTQQVTLHWKWSLWGDPLYILLESQGNLIAKYGNIKAIKRASDTFAKRASYAKPLIKTHLFEEMEFKDWVSNLNNEEYVLDNRHGSKSMEVEQEISKTVTNSLTIEESNIAQLAVTAGIAGVIQGQITKDLSKRLGVGIGKSLSKRHTFRFSVRPGDAVVYTILWKNRVRAGTYNFLIDGERHTLPYQVQYDLLYEINSKPIRPHKKAKD